MFHVEHCSESRNSPDCSDYPAAKVGKSVGARSNSGKQEKAPKKY